MLASEFTQDGKIEFFDLPRKPLNLRNLQSAMFADRADLWRKPGRKGRKLPPPEQQNLL